MFTFLLFFVKYTCCWPSLSLTPHQRLCTKGRWSKPQRSMEWSTAGFCIRDIVIAFVIVKCSCSSRIL